MKETVIISCLAYLLALVVTGLVVARRNRKTSDFLVAGRSLNLPLTAISLAAVQIGVGIVLGSSSNGYEDGIWPGIYYALGCGLGLVFAGLVTARKLRSRESYVPLDFFAQRYGDSRGVRLWAAISNVPSLLGIFIAQMVAAGSILAGFGLPFSTGVLLCTAVVLIYCMMGGMWSVVFTDVVQVTVIMIAIPVFCAIAMVKYGQSGGDLIGIFSTPFIPKGMGTRFVYLVLPFLLSISVSYDAYIKIQSSKDSRTASRGACIAGLIVILVGTMCSVIGVVASKMFPGLTDGMFATAATGLLPPVLAGIVVAAILAAALSSASCILLSLGSSVSRDFYNRFLHPEVDQLDQLKNSKRVSQAAILVACTAGCVFALYITDILDAMIIFNYPYMGSMLIPLLGGLLWKGATRRGAFAAAIAGGCVGVVSFFIGIPGPLHGLMNTDLALLLAYAVSAVTLVTVSLMDNNKKKDMKEYEWPYSNELGERTDDTADVLVLGGGLAGCYAAIAAARHGKSVILVEKGATRRSGSAGTGFDHWESACTNPCSKVSPKEMAEAYVDEQDHYSNGIGHYIECREGYDRLLDMESFGGKIRDIDDEFKGAEFRDDETKLMFAYDYTNCYTLRVWGSTFKPALRNELKRLGVKVYDRVEATALLTAMVDGKKRGIGAMGMNVRTGRFMVFKAKATILTMSRPARIWLFDSDMPGICEFRPPQSIGSGHAMGWRAGVEFTMMEKSVRAEMSSAIRSFPPYGAGNNHNTWYGATMVDARGVEIPYLDRDGNELKDVSQRFHPAPGQKFFLKGGVIDEPKYDYRGPETMAFDKLMERGYKLPFYADLSRMPALERKAIWGMMVGEEGKTKIPILQNYTQRGFDPEKHMLQSYGTGWTSAQFLDQERQLFGAPGGIITDWDLKTNIDGIYAAGDQLFASDCAGHACATGYYAGRKAAAAAESMDFINPCEEDIQAEMDRLYRPLLNEDGYGWKELNKAISRAMQNYCGGIKCEENLREGLDLLESYRKEIVPNLHCENPHELMRTHEVMDILDVATMILHACLMRESSSAPLCFERSDHPEMDPEQDRCFITIRQENGAPVRGVIPHDYFGDLEEEYEKRNQDYINNGRR